MLSRMGYEPVIVADGKEVLRQLETKKIDLIFMDVQMEEMDGIEATGKIIQKWGKQRPLIIAMTAFAMESDKEKCLNAGMDDYVSKPIKPDDLHRIITTWASKAKNGNRPEPDAAGINSDVIDSEAIHHIRHLSGSSDDVFLFKVIDMYMKQAPVLIESMVNYQQHSDLTNAEHAAHKLKSSSFNIGAKQVGELAEQIELKCRENNAVEIAKLISQIGDAYRDAEVELLKLINQGS